MDRSKPCNLKALSSSEWFAFQSSSLGTPRASNVTHVLAKRGYESGYKKQDSNHNKLERETSVTISISQKLIYMADS